MKKSISQSPNSTYLGNDCFPPSGNWPACRCRFNNLQMRHSGRSPQQPRFYGGLHGYTYPKYIKTDNLDSEVKLFSFKCRCTCIVLMRRHQRLTVKPWQIFIRYIGCHFTFSIFALQMTNNRTRRLIYLHRCDMAVPSVWLMVRMSAVR